MSDNGNDDRPPRRARPPLPQGEDGTNPNRQPGPPRRARNSENWEPSVERGSLNPRGQKGKDAYDYERIFMEEDRAQVSPFERVKSASPKTLKRVGVIVVAIVVLLFGMNYARGQVYPKGPEGAEINLTVKKGSTTADIANLLASNGVVPSAFGFRAYAKLTSPPEFKAGEYAFHKNLGTPKAIDVLKAGPKKRTDRITIPEGFTVDQIAQRVGTIPGFSGEKFMQVVQQDSYRSSFAPNDLKTPEGFLFPNTYLISDTDHEDSLFAQMINQFDAQAGAVGLNDAERIQGRSAYDILIIASMIEREARVPEDRGKIAQVINNRLAANMPLQVDATVLYALGKHKDVVTNSDLKVNSPYNTYLNKGLPPAPICNPGVESIKAALRPEPGPWLYYVVIDPATGKHAFARTFEEHQRNIAIANAKAKAK